MLPVGSGHIKLLQLQLLEVFSDPLNLKSCDLFIKKFAHVLTIRHFWLQEVSHSLCSSLHSHLTVAHHLQCLFSAKLCSTCPVTASKELPEKNLPIAPFPRKYETFPNYSHLVTFWNSKGSKSIKIPSNFFLVVVVNSILRLLFNIYNYLQTVYILLLVPDCYANVNL